MYGEGGTCVMDGSGIFVGAEVPGGTIVRALCPDAMTTRRQQGQRSSRARRHGTKCIPCFGNRKTSRFGAILEGYLRPNDCSNFCTENRFMINVGFRPDFFTYT